MLYRLVWAEPWPWAVPDSFSQELFPGSVTLQRPPGCGGSQGWPLWDLLPAKESLRMKRGRVRKQGGWEHNSERPQDWKGLEISGFWLHVICGKSLYQPHLLPLSFFQH